MKRSRIRSRPADNHLTAAEWEQVFQQLLVRSGGQCEGRTPWCQAPSGSVLGMPRERVSIQHRRAQGVGGTALNDAHDLANLLLLCGTGTTGCHGWVEIGERAAAETRGLWIRHDYRDGKPVPAAEYPLVLHSGRRVLLHPTDPTYLPHPNPWGACTLSAHWSTDMTKTFDYSRVQPYVPVIGAPEALLVDLDGTLCLHNGRDPYDETKVGDDLVNEPVRRVVLAVAAYTRAKVFALSGRSEGCREASEAWLARHFPTRYEALLMRPAGDTRSDWQVKLDLFNDRIRGRYNVAAVFDDRRQVVDMWRAMGVPVFQVAEGNF